jgi:3-oxoacyl-[acyl-carrier-protein] synthase III
MIRSVVRGVGGGYLPEKVLTNDDLAAMVETSERVESCSAPGSRSATLRRKVN